MGTGLDGYPHSWFSWLLAWETKLRRLPSLRKWARDQGYAPSRRGTIPREAIAAYRKRHHVLTPTWLIGKGKPW